jgi:hypothetical protein
VKVDFTVCEHFAKSGSVAAKQFVASKHALTDIPVWQRRYDLRSVLEGGVPAKGEVRCVRSRSVERKRGDLERRVARWPSRFLKKWCVEERVQRGATSDIALARYDPLLR